MIETVAGLESAPENGGGRSMMAALWQMREAIAVILGVASTMVALGLVIHELWDRELTPLTMLATSGVSFWAALIASLLVEPATDCYLLRRLLGTGIETLAPLLHKQSLNALLFGYAGDTLLAGWLRRHVGNARGALVVVCDMAIVSALVNNVAALAMLALLWRPIRAISDIRIDGWTTSLAAALVAVPLILMMLRRSKLPGSNFTTIFVVKSVRTVVASILVALTWHYALPGVPLLSWLMLLTGRMVVSRLPIIPNKDLAFAGVVSLFLGSNDQVVSMIAGVALLMLAVQAIMIAFAPFAIFPRRSGAGA